MGIIAASKATYRMELVKAISSTFTVRAALQKSSKHMKPEIKGIDEGHEPYLVDVDILLNYWDDMQAQTIARCWVKANVLFRGLNAKLTSVYGKLS